MSYKTLLVHVDDTKNVAARIETAARLALAHDAHLIGTAMTGISRFLYESMALDQGSPNLVPYLHILRQRTDGALNQFENIVRRIGVRSFEKRLTDDEAAAGISLQARYCDLVILGQHDPKGASSSTYADVPEHVVLNGGCPALIVPFTGAFNDFSDRVLIAWNASMEAARAVRHALPLLQRAKTVEVIIFNPPSRPDAHGVQPDADIGAYLARHNINADVMQEKIEGDRGKALLSIAANLHSNLLVMGCYGHTRIREILLGGTTRTILKSMTVPVLMSH